MDNKTILLVEDDVDLSTLMTKKLIESGFTPVAVQTGQEALDYLQNSKPDLILLDILLPDIDGISILTEISSSNKTKDIPVLILSNLDEQGSFDQVSAIGDYEYLVKAKTELNTIVEKIKTKLRVK